MADVLERAADYMWRSARVLERRRFSLLVGDGSADDVVRALAAYQNDDGGFGNALEPDIRTPLSQPQPAEIALHVLHEAGAYPAPIVSPLLGWLESETRDGGVPFVLHTAAQHPHAPWWAGPPDAPPNINPTAPIAGLLHAGGVQHPWLERATEWVWSQIEPGDTEQPLDGSHAVLTVLVFLQHVPDRARAEAALATVEPALRANVELDPGAAGYVKYPLDYAPAADSIARRFFGDDVVERHLDALIAKQADDGAWPISWDPPSEAARAEWRGMITVNALRTLRSYARL